MLRMLLFLICPAVACAEDAVGRLNIAGYRHREMCSATLVAPDRALTAAHCVATVADGYLKRIADMTFVAGWDGTDHAGAARITAIDVHPDAFADGQFDLRHDLALVRLDRALSPPPRRIARADATGPFTLIGYRRSAPHRQTETPYCFGAPASGLWRIRCRVEPGQSGGAVLSDNGDLVATIVAVTEEEALVVPVDDWLQRALQD